MKKTFLILLCAILLAGCERPATSSSWSPINDVNTPLPAVTTSAAASLTQTQETIATPWPTLDLGKFPNPLPEAFKGYELVSWQTGEDWNFTLITGTNREKTFEELLDPESQVTEDGFVKITVCGVDQIKKVLEMLPAESQVFWGGMDLTGQVPEGTVYFSYPPQAVMDELAEFCAQNEIILLNLSESK